MLRLLRVWAVWVALVLAVPRCLQNLGDDRTAHFERNLARRLSTADLSRRERQGFAKDDTSHEFIAVLLNERTEELSRAEQECSSPEVSFVFWLAHLIVAWQENPRGVSMAYGVCVPRACSKQEVEAVMKSWADSQYESLGRNALDTAVDVFRAANQNVSREELQSQAMGISRGLMAGFNARVWLEPFREKTACEQDVVSRWQFLSIFNKEFSMRSWRQCTRAEFGTTYWKAAAVMNTGGDASPCDFSADSLYSTHGLCLPKSCTALDVEVLATYNVRMELQSRVAIAVEAGDALHTTVSKADSRWVRHGSPDGSGSDGLSSTYEAATGCMRISLYIKAVVSKADAIDAFNLEDPAKGDVQRKKASSTVSQVKGSDDQPLINEGMPCELPRKFVFLDTSWHLGARLDVAAVLASLNQTIILPLFLGFPWKPPWPQLRTEGLEELTDPKVGSTVFRRHLHLPSGINGYKLTEQEVRTNFEALKMHPIMDEIDAIIVTGALGPCELWMPFNKTIIALSSMGWLYMNGRCSRQEWERLDDHLLSLASSDRPRNIIAAANHWDREYLELYLGLDAPLLETTPWFYMPPMESDVQPVRPEFLVYCDKVDGGLCPSLIKEMTVRVAEHGATVPFRSVYDLYPVYEFEDLLRHPAIVVMPYALYTFGMAEIYAIGLPMFLPSPNFLARLCKSSPVLPCQVNGSGIAITSGNFDYFAGAFGCDSEARRLAEDWNLPSRHRSCPRHLQFLERVERGTFPGQRRSRHGPAPWSEASCWNRTAWEYWVQFIEAYRWPHVISFDSWKDLASLLASVDFSRVRAAMKVANLARAREVRGRWCGALQEALVDAKPRKVPRSYTEALAGLGLSAQGRIMHPNGDP